MMLEGRECKTRLRSPNRKSSVAPCTKITGKPQSTVTVNAVFLRESCVSKPTLCEIKDGKTHVQPVHRTTDRQAGGAGLVYALQLEECFPVGNQLSQNPREEPGCLEPLSAPNSAYRTQVSHLQSSCLKLERGNMSHLQTSV